MEGVGMKILIWTALGAGWAGTMAMIAADNAPLFFPFLMFSGLVAGLCRAIYLAGK